MITIMSGNNYDMILNRGFLVSANHSGINSPFLVCYIIIMNHCKQPLNHDFIFRVSIIQPIICHKKPTATHSSKPSISRCSIIKLIMNSTVIDRCQLSPVLVNFT